MRLFFGTKQMTNVNIANLDMLLSTIIAQRYVIKTKPIILKNNFAKNVSIGRIAREISAYASAKSQMKNGFNAQTHLAAKHVKITKS